jgi:hypothetical protein
VQHAYGTVESGRGRRNNRLKYNAIFTQARDLLCSRRATSIDRTSTSSHIWSWAADTTTRSPPISSHRAWIAGTAAGVPCPRGRGRDGGRQCPAAEGRALSAAGATVEVFASARRRVLALAAKPPRGAVLIRQWR